MQPTTTLPRHKLALAIAHPITAYRIRKAKNQWRKDNPTCACCNARKSASGKACDVHHLTPVHIAPDSAADPCNLITLCRWCHFNIGHFGSWICWNCNIDDTMFSLQAEYIHMLASYGCSK